MRHPLCVCPDFLPPTPTAPSTPQESILGCIKAVAWPLLCQLCVRGGKGRAGCLQLLPEERLWGSHFPTAWITSQSWLEQHRRSAPCLKPCPL